jgi:broad specificity phosphatase PhoE
LSYKTSIKGSTLEIVLIRHGKPQIDTTGIVSPAEFGRWVAEYDMAGIDKNHIPTERAIQKAADCTFIVCSHLPRSIESAEFLNIPEPGLISPLFRECEMPYSNWQYPKLPKIVWPVLFRLFQMTAYSANSGSYKEMRKRSHDCAIQLTAFARNHGSVLFVGHGVLIWLIHQHLLEMGWSGPKKSPKSHWEFGEYTYNEA